MKYSVEIREEKRLREKITQPMTCLLYTSDAADE